VCLGRRRDRGQPSLIGTGRYVDDLVRTADGWKFAKRLAVLDIELATMLEALERL
jgi:hypothetical protein